MTYGFYRAEALGALATVVIIWYVTGILSYLAVERLHTGQFEIQVSSTDVSFARDNFGVNKVEAPSKYPLKGPIM
jgi:divalent metal cation (Fe/Co/Zn/Cd) transporter